MAEIPGKPRYRPSGRVQGLKAQYLFIFCGGLLALFVLFVILYMSASTSGYVSVSARIVLPLAWQTFALNARTANTADELGSAHGAPSPVPYQPRRITRLFNDNERKK